MTPEQAEEFTQGLLQRLRRIFDDAGVAAFVVLVKDHEGEGSYVGYASSMSAVDTKRITLEVLAKIGRRPRPA